VQNCGLGSEEEGRGIWARGVICISLRERKRDWDKKYYLLKIMGAKKCNRSKRHTDRWLLGG